MARSPSGVCRVHVVLIPGFGGFDALGQLEYYAGITPLFQSWKKNRANRARVVLHYFDNFPTAAVITRAARLQAYLAKRIARGEFQPEDAVVLVGHSTGGLDIRRFIYDLARREDKPITVDGGGVVDPDAILDLIHGVVFLSVPQWGTNIADWVRSCALGREAVVCELRAAVAASQLLLLDKLEADVTGAAARFTDADGLRACQDALKEADPCPSKPSPLRLANAHESASELGLWLRHIGSDFSAIDDLAAQPPRGHDLSPAHFSPRTRGEEVALWKSKMIQTRSYATIGRRAFQFDEGKPAPPWDLLKLWTYPDCTRSNGLGAAMDVLYRIGYRACAGGPFDHPVSRRRMPKCLNPSLQRRLDQWGHDHRIELWDNDGIVNTASMLWPHGEKTLLVPGDHMDIVGHYRLVEAIKGNGRTYQAYDLLRSASEFEDDDTFGQVWYSVFDFCLSAAKQSDQSTGHLEYA